MCLQAVLKSAMQFYTNITGTIVTSMSSHSRSRAKSRDDIMALMHVVYTGSDAVPIQQDTEL